MHRVLRHKWLTVLSAFVLLLQLFAPTLAVASGTSPSLICNPSGQVSAEMEAALEALKDVLGIEDADEKMAMDCEDCVPSAYAVASTNSKLVLALGWVHSFITPRSHKFTLASPRGPPLGSRAPPYSL